MKLSIPFTASGVRCLGCALALLVATGVAAPAAELVNSVAAVVNGEVITLLDVKRKADPFIERLKQTSQGALPPLEEVYRKVVDTMVDEILLAQEAERYQIEVSSMEIETQINQFKRQNDMSEEEFERRLRVEKKTREEYEAEVKDEIIRHRLLGSMVTRKVVITSDEIEAYYKENLAQFATGKEVTLRLIVLAHEGDATALRGRIVSDELSFEDAANTYSMGPGVGEGGALGTFAWSDLGQDWRDALQGLNPGDVSAPFTLNGQPALLKLEALKAGDVTPLTSVADQIEATLRQPRMEERFREYLQSLREKAVVDVKL